MSFPNHSSAFLDLAPESIDALIRRMRHEWSPTTLVMTVLKFKQIGRHLSPAANLKWLSVLAGDLKAEVGPVRRLPVVDAAELVIAGLTLIEEYSAPDTRRWCLGESGLISDVAEPT